MPGTYFGNNLGAPITDSSQDAQNYSITTSFSNNSVTFTLKDKDGNTPTPSSPVIVRFSDLYGVRDATTNQALSLTVAQGVALGTTNADDYFLYLYGINNNGVLALAVTCNNIYGPSITSNLAVSTVQLTDLSSSRLILYSDAVYTNVSARLLGRFSSNQTSAGQWASTFTDTRLVPTPVPVGAMDAIDSKANTTNGGTFISGSYQTRTLNSQTYTLLGLAPDGAITTNIISLSTGTYRISGCASAHVVGVNKLKLTSSTDQSIGLSTNSRTASGSNDYAMIEDILSVTTGTTFTFSHYCLTTQNADGFGNPASFGDVEVYSNLLIEKIR